jgi:hypothetical protein
VADQTEAANAFTALRQLARQSRQTGQADLELCELCSEPIPAEHRHLLEIATRQVACVCRPCSILFDREAAGLGKYRLIPDRRLNLAGFQMSDAQWESLRIPVGMAFFFHSTPAGRVLAYYPGPMGATESLLELETWDELVESNPILGQMAPDVEALLVNRARGAHDHFLVPIDECFRLIAVLRTSWRGFTGGQEVWDEIGSFFRRLGARSTAWPRSTGSANTSSRKEDLT